MLYLHLYGRRISQKPYKDKHRCNWYRSLLVIDYVALTGGYGAGIFPSVDPRQATIMMIYMALVVNLYLRKFILLYFLMFRMLCFYDFSTFIER